jgi:hypothetical protein
MAAWLSLSFWWEGSWRWRRRIWATAIEGIDGWEWWKPTKRTIMGWWGDMTKIAQSSQSAKSL